jgi:hypothetical protein
MGSLDFLWQNAVFEILWKLVVLSAGGILLTWAKTMDEARRAYPAVLNRIPRCEIGSSI